MIKKIITKCYDTIFALSDKKYFGYPGYFTYTKENGINLVMLPVTKKIIKISYGVNEPVTKYKLLEEHKTRKSLEVYLYLGDEYVNHVHLDEIKEIIKNHFTGVL